MISNQKLCAQSIITESIDYNGLRASCFLEMHASNKALLIPLIVNVSTSITSPLRGMIIYDSSNNKLSYYNGSSWRQLDEGNDTNIYTGDGMLLGNRVVTMSGRTLSFNGGNVGIGAPSPSQLLDIQKSGSDNYIRLQAGATTVNNAGILFNEYNNEYGWRMR